MSLINYTLEGLFYESMITSSRLKKKLILMNHHIQKSKLKCIHPLKKSINNVCTYMSFSTYSINL